MRPLLAFLLGLTIMYCLLAQRVQAHDWYPSDCCSGKDCFPVPCEEIKSEGNSWIWHKYWFAKDKARVSQDGACHVCIAYGTSQCIFLGGTS